MDGIQNNLSIFNSLMFWIVAAPILVLAAWRIVVQKPWGKPPSWILAIRDGLGLSGLPNSVILFAAVLWGAFFAALTLSALFILSGTLVRMFPNGESDATDLRWSMLALAGVIAALGGVIAIPFTFLRTKNSAENTDIEFQGQITDRITNAVRGLGDVKAVTRHRKNQKGTPLFEDQTKGDIDLKKPIFETVTLPNMEVRVGAIYALERIAQDSLRDHVQIMEILCAYIRENSPASSALAVPDISDLKFDQLSSSDDGQELRYTLADRLQTDFGDNIQTRLDIQTAITVLGRRKPRQRQKEAEANNGETGDEFIFDTPFPAFPEILGLEDKKIAELARSYRGTAGETRRSFGSYRGQRLDLRHFNAQKFDFAGMCLRGLDFRNAKMQGADLSGAKMQGADLSDAKFDISTNCTATNFRSVAVQYVNFTRLTQFSEHLNDMFGDATVTLPDGLKAGSPDWPAHWPKIKMDYVTFQLEWRKWQDDPDGYMPPKSSVDGDGGLAD